MHHLQQGLRREFPMLGTQPQTSISWKWVFDNELDFPTWIGILGERIRHLWKTSICLSLSTYWDKYPKRTSASFFKKVIRPSLGSQWAWIHVNYEQSSTALVSFHNTHGGIQMKVTDNTWPLCPDFYLWGSRNNSPSWSGEAEGTFLQSIPNFS